MNHDFSKRLDDLEDQGNTGTDDDDLRVEIIRRTVDGEMVKKTICHYDEDGNWTTEDVDGFNYNIEYE